MRLNAGSHQENNVGMEQVGHDLHLVDELFENRSVELDVVQNLDRDILASATALVNLAESTLTNRRIKGGDFWERG